MRAALSWTAFGLAASGALAASTPSSYSDFVKSFPACGQPCMDTLYSNMVGDSCSDGAKSSTDPSDIKCICTAGGFEGSTGTAGDAGKCYVKNCGSDDVSSMTENMSGFIDLCKKSSGASGSSSGGSSDSESSSSDSGSSSDGQSGSDGNGGGDGNAASSWRNVPAVTGVSAFLTALVLL